VQFDDLLIVETVHEKLNGVGLWTLIVKHSKFDP
jgi:hypothetical protein